MMETIAAKELDQYVQKRGTLIVDLRSREEYVRGHIRGAINVPDGEFGTELLEHQNDTIVLYCTRGALSMAVARELDELGFDVKSVVGGIKAYREWRRSTFYRSNQPENPQKWKK